MPIKIGFLADIADYVRGTRNAADATDNVIDSLQGIADEAKLTSRNVDTDMRDIAQVSERASDSLERDMRQAFDAVKKESKDAGRDVGRNVERGMDDAGELTGEFKDEARSNFAEVTSSFDGSMDSIADLAQGTLGGLAGSIAGPFGVAAGLVAAAGGLFYSKWAESTEASKERVSEMYDDMLQSGADFLSNDFLQTQISNIVTGAEGAVASMDEVRNTAQTLGVTEKEVLLAFAGHMETRARLTDLAIEKQEEFSGNTAGMTDAQAAAYDNTYIAASDALDKLQALNGEFGTATDNINLTRDTVGLLNTELYAIPEEIRTKAILDYDDAYARAKLDGFISDIERRRIVLTIDPRLTDHGRQTL